MAGLENKTKIKVLNNLVNNRFGTYACIFQHYALIVVIISSFQMQWMGIILKIGPYIHFMVSLN